MPGLVFEGVGVGYARDAIVSGVTLSVTPGEMVGVIGPNGAGKTTLLRAVTGDARVTAGRLLVSDREREAYGAREMAREVAVLPQTPPTAFAFSARAFVEMGRHPHVPRLREMAPHDHDAVRRAMALTDTERLADVPVDTLSGGDLQRLTLAQALAQEPRVLLLDEPTSHLDLDHTLQILSVVRRLADEGLAVLAVFHDLTLAARYCDRLAVVADGGLRAVGTPADVLDTRILAEVFHVRAVVGTDVVTGAVSVTPVMREESLARGGHYHVLVISGASTGASLMRSLVEAGYRVSAGALNRGDTDQAVAEALGIPHFELPPFGEVDVLSEKRVQELAGHADAVVVARTPFGEANLGNLRAALTTNRPVIVVDTAEERDFCRGEARRYLARALAHGAVEVPSDAAVIPALRRLFAL